MSELTEKSAIELASLIKQKKLSARECIDAHIAAIEKSDNDINAVVVRDFETARSAASAADKVAAQDRYTGPLHGVPITVKDTICVSGMRCTAGLPDLENHIPERDAASVASLRKAGAIFLGKTNAPLLAGDVHTYNDIFGETKNPLDLERTPGGSSGGSAAALAAGFVPLELGSDIAGSIRTPAHYCGVYGHKPSHGLVPLDGHIPGPPGSINNDDLATLGPMARSADDLRLALSLMARPEPAFSSLRTSNLAPARHTNPLDTRVGILTQAEGYGVNDETQRCLADVEIALRSTGIHVERIAWPFRPKEMMSVYLSLLFAVMGSGYPAELKESLQPLAADVADPTPQAIAAAARGIFLTHSQWQSFDQQRCVFRRKMTEVFAHYDVIISPVAPFQAPRRQTDGLLFRQVDVDGTEISQLDGLFWSALHSLCYLPATAIPFGKSSDGMPIGIQVGANHLEDLTALAFASFLSKVGSVTL